MMYANEKVYVRMEREVVRESFSFYTSRSIAGMIGNSQSNGMIDMDNTIDAVVSNYAGTPLFSGAKYNSRKGPAHLAYHAEAQPQLNATAPRLIEYKRPEKVYASFNYNPLNYFQRPRQEYFVAENFLHAYRPDTQFVDDAAKIEEHIKDAFSLVTGEELPKHIQIIVCEADKFRMLHEANGGKFMQGIQGFAVHAKQQIVIKQNKLDVVMLVVGHELGHLLSAPLSNAHDEEAKAFAFEMEWMKVIKRHNVANLAANINTNFQPANNGLHDVAFRFVKNLINAGKRAMDVFKGLVSGEISMKSACCED